MSKKSISTKRIRCPKCRHYFVTWDSARPHGCRGMGFKSHRLPSAVVYQNSGAPCRAFEPNSPTIIAKRRQP